MEAFTMLRRMDIGKVLVPVSGNGVDSEVIGLACEIAEKNGATVYVVYVIEVDRSMPLDAPDVAKTSVAEDILVRAEDIARADGYQIDTGLIQAREAGAAIVEEARDGGVDLIVMGVGYRRRLARRPGEFDIGDTTSHVLREAPCHVILYRAPLEAEDTE
jgi:nucleotide-binding universal stress UspA family protein